MYLNIHKHAHLSTMSTCVISSAFVCSDVDRTCSKQAVCSTGFAQMQTHHKCMYFITSYNVTTFLFPSASCMSYPPQPPSINHPNSTVLKNQKEVPWIKTLTPTCFKVLADINNKFQLNYYRQKEMPLLQDCIMCRQVKCYWLIHLLIQIYIYLCTSFWFP